MVLSLACTRHVADISLALPLGGHCNTLEVKSASTQRLGLVNNLSDLSFS